MDYAKRFLVRPGRPIRLSKCDPATVDPRFTRSTAIKEMGRLSERLEALQYLLYADGHRALMVCFQGLDAAGKDGSIRRVMGCMGPAGVNAYSFKVPTEEEAAHDFLWRVHLRTPRKGEVAIFNRSHYEDVLVPRVHGTVKPSIWRDRYGQINAFEQSLTDAGVMILKFFLHMSQAEQLLRFDKRLDDPMRRWKISEADYTERTRFDAYTVAYEEIFDQTSTAHAPWYVIPADHKWFRDLAISTILVGSLETLGLSAPKPSVDLADIRRRYHSAVQAAKRGR